MEAENQIPDAVLVKNWQSGHQGAMDLLVERHRRRLYGFIMRLAGRHEAEEVFQEVWLRVVKNIHRYHDKCFGAWLFRIARNLIVDRQRARREHVSLNAPDAFGVEVQERMTDGYPAPDVRTAQAELHARLNEAVARLPDEQREVFLMRMEGGLAFKDIAAIQRVSINTALARMHYAVNRLREMMPDDGAG